MLGPLISAGASLLGGLFGKSSADKARASQEALAQQNIAQQREFAQHGIRWRVEDAKAAGIHPIYALGSGGASFSPVSAAFTSDTSLPNALASAGQDIGRAIHSTRTAGERGSAFSSAATKLQLEGLSLDNDLKRTEIASKAARLRADQVGPTAPGSDYLMPGQASSGIKNKPLEVAPGHPGAPSQESGSITDTGIVKTEKGWARMPSKDVKERLEDMPIYEAQHFIRTLNQGPPFKAPAGKIWEFNAITGEWTQKTYNLFQPKRSIYNNALDRYKFYLERR